MGLADKDKLSCPLLLHMIFSTLCTGFTPVKEKKGSFFTEKDLLIRADPFHLYSVRHLIHLRLLLFLFLFHPSIRTSLQPQFPLIQYRMLLSMLLNVKILLK